MYIYTYAEFKLSMKCEFIVISANMINFMDNEDFAVNESITMPCTESGIWVLKHLQKHTYIHTYIYTRLEVCSAFL